MSEHSFEDVQNNIYMDLNAGPEKINLTCQAGVSLYQEYLNKYSENVSSFVLQEHLNEFEDILTKTVAEKSSSVFAILKDRSFQASNWKSTLASPDKFFTPNSCQGVFEKCKYTELKQSDLPVFRPQFNNLENEFTQEPINNFQCDQKYQHSLLPNEVLANININRNSSIPQSSFKNAILQTTTEKSSNQQNSIETKSGFKTARAELELQNLKKNNQSSSNQQPLFSYGNSKKSLGVRRCIQNKFVPPIKQEIESNDSDERYNNIDPIMIESIRNEIMHKIKPVAWDDIAGLEYAKSTIEEAIVWPFLRPEVFNGLKGPPRGILLFGPPGTGKTLIGKCIASQSKSTFFSISASAMTSKWIGDGEKMVRALFAVAAVHQPSVIFIDEIDSLLCKRSETEHESSRRIKTEFLCQFDGTKTSEEDRVLIVGATNRPQEIDDAARRRLVRRLYIPLPEMKARIQILTNLLKSERHELNSDEINNVGTLTDGYSAADMETLCKEASMEPYRSIPSHQIQYFIAEDIRRINFGDFQTALKRIRPSVSQKDIEQYVKWNEVFGTGLV